MVFKQIFCPFIKRWINLPSLIKIFNCGDIQLQTTRGRLTPDMNFLRFWWKSVGFFVVFFLIFFPHFHRIFIYTQGEGHVANTHSRMRSSHFSVALLACLLELQWRTQQFRKCVRNIYENKNAVMLCFFILSLLLNFEKLLFLTIQKVYKNSDHKGNRQIHCTMKTLILKRFLYIFSVSYFFFIIEIHLK